MLGGGLACVVMGFEYLGKGVFPPALVYAILCAGALLLVAYALYSRGHGEAMLDLSLMRIPSFSASIYGGTILRISVGATSLLLPLMLQLAFGRTPLMSGLITFAAAAGSLPMKLIAPGILSRFGFRRVLIVNSLICAAMLAASATFSADTPAALLLLITFGNGLFRSLQFTSVNVLGFADIEPQRMSQASSLASTVQQVAMSVGVGLATQMLLFSQNLRGGGSLVGADFSLGFIGLAALSVLGTGFYLRLRPDAGGSVSGHRQEVAA